MADKGRQGEIRPRKAGTPSKTGRRVGIKWETRGNETSARRLNHPTNVKRKETMADKRRQDLGKAGTPSNTKAGT